ncbi:MAG: heme-binding protein [Ruminococcaceae bacterium]|nr:heme-binding protein [Oscillospiraceae bacterium]
MDNKKRNDAVNVDEIVSRVLENINSTPKLTLKKAVKLMSAVEDRARALGKQIAIAIVNAEGNTVAVHVMDGAYLVSCDVAVKKAYTSVAVKMPTLELQKLCQPGETFYGLQANDKLVIFGGGIPLVYEGKIIGGLGISGGTGEEDHALCEYALTLLGKVL